MRRSPRVPLKMRLADHIPPGTMPRVALYGFVLNALWEFGHAGLLYDMWDEVRFWDGMFHITLAILGDVVIVLGVTLLAGWCVGLHSVLPPNWKGWFALFFVGLLAGIGLEWIAIAQDWWTYNDRMPTLTVFDETVGLSPVIQVMMTPAMSVLLATRFH